MNWDPAVTERTALHEAGHAVVAWSFGLTVGSIHLDLATQGGHAMIASVAKLNPVEQIVRWLAGYEAEQMFKPPGRKAKAMIDFGEVSRILRENGTPEETPEGHESKVVPLPKRACANTRPRCAALPFT